MSVAHMLRDTSIARMTVVRPAGHGDDRDRPGHRDDEAGERRQEQGERQVAADPRRPRAARRGRATGSSSGRRAAAAGAPRRGRATSSGRSARSTSSSGHRRSISAAPAERRRSRHPPEPAQRREAADEQEREPGAGEQRGDLDRLGVATTSCVLDVCRRSGSGRVRVGGRVVRAVGRRGDAAWSIASSRLAVDREALDLERRSLGAADADGVDPDAAVGGRLGRAQRIRVARCSRRRSAGR